MRTIDIDLSLSNNALLKHKYIHNIKILYKYASTCDSQQQFKDIPEAAMMYTPEGFIDNSPVSTIIPTPVKKSSTKKSLCIFTNILDVKKRTYIR